MTEKAPAAEGNTAATDNPKGYIELDPTLDALRSFAIAQDLMPLLVISDAEGNTVLAENTDEEIASMLSALIVGSVTMEALAERVAGFWRTERGMVLAVEEDEEEDEEEEFVGGRIIL